MSGMEWSFYRDFRNKYGTNKQKTVKPLKKWDVMVAVYEEGQNQIPTKLNFNGIEAEKINVCFKDKYLIISESSEMQGLDIDENQYVLNNIETPAFEKLIGFPRTIKKVAFSAIQMVS